MSEIENARDGGPPPRLDRIAGPDRTGTAFAVVDALGRLIDVDLRPSWWLALGPAHVAAGLVEALATARLKAALVPMILRGDDYGPLSIDAVRDRFAEASRLIDQADKRPAVRVVAGPGGLFRVHARGGRIEWAEVTAILGGGDTDRLLADARHALAAATE